MPTLPSSKPIKAPSDTLMKSIAALSKNLKEGNQPSYAFPFPSHLWASRLQNDKLTGAAPVGAAFNKYFRASQTDTPAFAVTSPAGPVFGASNPIYVIHPLIGDCLRAISEEHNVPFDDLVSLFAQYGLLKPEESFKGLFLSADDPMAYCYDYDNAPEWLQQELQEYSSSTGYNNHVGLNRLLYYSLLHYYSGKLLVPTISAEK